MGASRRDTICGIMYRFGCRVEENTLLIFRTNWQGTKGWIKVETWTENLTFLPCRSLALALLTMERQSRVRSRIKKVVGEFMARAGVGSGMQEMLRNAFSGSAVITFFGFFCSTALPQAHIPVDEWRVRNVWANLFASRINNSRGLKVVVAKLILVHAFCRPIRGFRCEISPG